MKLGVLIVSFVDGQDDKVTPVFHNFMYLLKMI